MQDTYLPFVFLGLCIGLFVFIVSIVWFAHSWHQHCWHSQPKKDEFHKERMCCHCPATQESHLLIKGHGRRLSFSLSQGINTVWSKWRKFDTWSPLLY